MTDQNETNESNNDYGDMNPRFENLAAYVLDALDDENERAAVETLIEADAEAHAEFIELSEAAGHLAMAARPVAPPVHLKATILALASTESGSALAPAPALTQPAPYDSTASRSWWANAFRSGYASSAVAAVLVLIVGGALGYQNNQLGNEIDVLRADLVTESVVVANLQTKLSTTLIDSDNRAASMKSEMDLREDEFGVTTKMVVHQEEMVSELAVANDALTQALQDQIWLTYVAMNGGYQLASWLANAQPSAADTNASGLIAVRVVGNEAVFQVHGLPQPAPGFAYTLWLIGYGDPQAVSQFEISEIGSATVAFLL
ncbi:MAG: hypothetical protein V3T49_07275, partial [Dehalococcoidia bacterium]